MQIYLDARVKNGEMLNKKRWVKQQIDLSQEENIRQNKARYCFSCTLCKYIKWTESHLLLLYFLDLLDFFLFLLKINMYCLNIHCSVNRILLGLEIYYIIGIISQLHLLYMIRNNNMNINNQACWIGCWDKIIFQTNWSYCGCSCILKIHLSCLSLTYLIRMTISLSWLLHLHFSCYSNSFLIFFPASTCCACQRKAKKKMSISFLWRSPFD